MKREADEELFLEAMKGLLKKLIGELREAEKRTPKTCSSYANIVKALDIALRVNEILSELDSFIRKA